MNNKKAQIRWFIIAVLVVVIAGLLFYHDITAKYLGLFAKYIKPVTGYASGVAKEVVHNVTS